jgi:3-phenylpropionate/trans-cinnamate dioxygenase ferredoxin subunit
MPWHPLSLSAPLEAGQKTTVEIDGKEILICRIEAGYFAVAGRCTHSAWPLSRGSIRDMEIVCTLHGARFDLRDGCPTAGPARRPLTTYPIELRGGELYIRL